MRFTKKGQLPDQPDVPVVASRQIPLRAAPVTGVCGAVVAVVAHLVLAGAAHGGGACAVSASEFTAPGCLLVQGDTASHANPKPLWRGLDCERRSRYQYGRKSGDRHPTATGRGQGNRTYRSLTVKDGDNVWGERCELGNNNRGDTFQIYREGERRITFVSVRLRKSFVLSNRRWQTVIQMKQAGPSNNSGGTPVLALNAYGGKWRLRQSLSPGASSNTRELWSAPARKRRWIRIAFDVTYSRHSGAGLVKLYIDVNGDGDALDAGERSPSFDTYTLKRETAGTTSDGIDEGESIPSHFRIGTYHDDRINCPRGCSLDFDNVQVVRPG